MNTQNTSNKDNNIPDDSLSFGDSEEDFSDYPQYKEVELLMHSVAEYLSEIGNKSVTFTDIVDYLVSIEDTDKTSYLSDRAFPLLVQVYEDMHKSFGKGDVFKKGEIQALRVRVQEAKRKGRGNLQKAKEVLSEDSEEEDLSHLPQYKAIKETIFAVLVHFDAEGNRNITFTEVMDFILSIEDTSKPSLLSEKAFPVTIAVWRDLHKKYGKGDVFRKGEIQALTVRIQEARRKGRDSDVKEGEKLSKEFKNTDEKEETKKAINKDNELKMKEAQIQEEYRPYKDAPKSVFFDFIKENYKDIIYIIFFITIIASGILTAIGVFDKDKNLLYNIFYIILGFFAGVISSIFILSIIYYTIKECIPLLLRSMTNRKTSDDDENLKQLELASFLFFLPINFILSSVLFGNKIIIIVFVLWWTGIYWVFYFIKEKIKEYHSIDSLTDVAINKLSFIAFFFIALIIVAYGYEMYINIDEDIIYGFFSILTLVTLYYTYNFNPFRTDK